MFAVSIPHFGIENKLPELRKLCCNFEYFRYLASLDDVVTTISDKKFYFLLEILTLKKGYWLNDNAHLSSSISTLAVIPRKFLTLQLSTTATDCDIAVHFAYVYKRNQTRIGQNQIKSCNFSYLA